MELLRILSIASLALGGLSAAAVLVDLLGGHPQKMPVMNWVWPITAIWSGPLGLWAYFRFGRMRQSQRKPFWQIAAVGTLHCAAGCTLGDFLGEWTVFFTGFAIGSSVLWSGYLLDFVLAYSLGIVFQYFAIAPMRNLSGWPGILAAIKADTISLGAFEIGMFAWMAYAHEVLFHRSLTPVDPAYWFMMQIAMAVGFLTSYPANWLLIRTGVKEAM